MSEQTVVTRFAPSPTGALHVGGARTALFNWAYARQHGGQFILRIEDTDLARSTRAATLSILRDLTWLGLDWDHGPSPDAEDDPYVEQIGDRGPYFQSQRLRTYHKYIEKLIDEGKAYKCFRDAEELAAQRAQARAEKRDYKYDRTESVNLTHAQVQQYEAEGRPHVVRFKVPENDLIIHDQVLGEVIVQAGELEDFVIRKSDGYPTYHFAVVVDDALMGVTHVIRGQEHLSNAPKHVALQDALGFDRPTYVHIPLIFNPDGTKMSKRDKAKVARAGTVKWIEDNDPQNTSDLFEPAGIDPCQFNAFLNKDTDELAVAEALARQLELALPEIDVRDFRRSGYLPGVLCNYLALLGWNPGDDVERFGDDPLGFIRDQFSFKRVGKSNSKFDRDKLLRFNHEAIVALPADAFRDKLKAHLLKYHHAFTALCQDDARFELFAQAYQPRTHTLSEPAELGAFFVIERVEAFDEKAVAKNLTKNDGEGLAILRELRDKLAAIEPWSGEAGHDAIRELAEAKGLGMGKIAQPLRVALTGTTVTPPLDVTLNILGKDATLTRVDDCLKRLG